MSKTETEPGMIPGAHPTAPGGMTLPALRLELVEKHGWSMDDSRDMIWGKVIEAVIQERLNRDAEKAAGPVLQGTVSEAAWEDLAASVSPDMFADDLDPEEADDWDSGDWTDVAVHEVFVEDPACKCGTEESAHNSVDPPHMFSPQGYDDEDPEPDDLTDDLDAEVDALLEEVTVSPASKPKPPSLFLGLPGTNDYIFDGHMGAGPSAAERWMNCTASLGAVRRFLETLSPNQQREYASANTAARQGTTAHMASEAKAKALLGQITHEEMEHTLMELTLNPVSEDESYDEEMGDFTDEYVDLIRQYHDEGREVRVEQRVGVVVPLPDVSEEGDGGTYEVRGSADLCVLPSPTERVLVVGDLKYGNGVDVDVESNPQIRIYALGVLNELADDEGNLPSDIERIDYIIHQPRLGGIKVWSESVDDLVDWMYDVLSPALAAALMGPSAGAVYAPSDLACQWCPVRGSCPALAEKVFTEGADLFDAIVEGEHAGHDMAEGFPETDALDGDRLGDLLRQVLRLDKIKADLKEEAQRRLHRGEQVKGFHLVNYTPARFWNEGADAKIDRLKVDPKTKALLFKPRTLITPTQAVKALGEQAKLLDPLIAVPDKRPVVAPVGDRRKAWGGAAPEAMFPDDL